MNRFESFNMAEPFNNRKRAMKRNRVIVREIALKPREKHGEFTPQGLNLFWDRRVNYLADTNMINDL